MAEIKDWKSNTAYDTELMQIPHYQVHPEMMPFVGEHFIKGENILLVGESHYLDESPEGDQHEYYATRCDRLSDLSKKGFCQSSCLKNCWYRKRLPDGFPCQTNFNTRDVIHRFQTGRRTRSYSMFRNPAKVAIEEWFPGVALTDSEAFGFFAFMNYFQRPASATGKTIENHDADNSIAAMTLNAVIEVLNPISVIFLSKKAHGEYERYMGKQGNKTCTLDIDFVNHPTCSHWYSENGEAKFKKLLQKPGNFSPIKQMTNTRAKKESIEAWLEQYVSQHKQYTIIHEKSRRFKQGVQTVRFYTEDKYEIVVRGIVGDKRVGIGYCFDTSLIWVWDYDAWDNKGDYINIDSPRHDFADIQGLEEMYNDFLQMIHEI